jgi:ankyrin repeat protein
MNYDKFESQKLLSAIEKGDYPSFQEALENNADPNFDPLQSNISPLILALSYNNERMALELLDKGANVNAKNNLGRCPLHIAAFQYMDTFIEKALKNPDIKINVYDKDGKTPMDFAVEADAQNVQEMFSTFLETKQKPSFSNDSEQINAEKSVGNNVPTEKTEVLHRKKLIFNKK